MSLKRTVFALGLGVGIGYVTKQLLDQNQNISPEKALDRAKEAFKQRGPINGSWIYMKPEEVEKNGLMYDVYRGGVTRNIDGENKQYEFYADAHTGTIIGTAEASV